MELITYLSPSVPDRTEIAFLWWVRFSRHGHLSEIVSLSVPPSHGGQAQKEHSCGVM